MSNNNRGVPPKSAPTFTRPPDATYDDPESDDRDYVRHQLVNNAITTQLVNRLTGKQDYGDTLYGADPSNQFFAGALSSQYEYREAQEEEGAFQDILDDIAPFTIGVRFRIPRDLPADAAITITPSATAYQRRFPAFDEQQAHSNDNNDAEVLYEDVNDEKDTQSLIPEHDQDEFDESVEGADTSPGQANELIRVFERLSFDWASTTLTATEIESLLDQDDPRHIGLDIESTLNEARSIDNRFREKDSDLSASEAAELPDEATDSPARFQEYLDSTFTGDEIDPLWDARLEVEARRDDSYINLTVRLVNRHGENYQEAEDPEFRDWRATLFDAGVEATVSGTELRPFESAEIEERYQYDGKIHGIGENCAIEPIFPTDTGDTSTAIGVKTTTVPTYEQSRYLSRNPRAIEAPYHVLAGNEGREAVFETLENIADAMETAHEQYKELRDDVTADKGPEATQEYDETLDEFAREHERFEIGIDVLRSDGRAGKRAYEAFTMMNEAFNRLGFERWRTFQIVFVVMTLPDIVAQAAGAGDSEEQVDPGFDHYLDHADVIYFPTGGGKTEAYLGLVTFTAFHDRLRGKDYGMTAFTKFPLRFLSLEQLGRVMNLLAKAELIRRDHPDTSTGDEFSVGYLVGKQNTPNKLYEDGNNYLTKARADEEWQADFRHIDECPFCERKTITKNGEERAAVQIDSDPEQGRIIHKCTNPACDEDALPIYVTDREVYRFAPTFVVSTIDKISIVGMQRRMRTLFGQAKYRCEKHGFSGESECVVQSSALPEEGECTDEHFHEIDPVDPPSLLIQDELHLLREEFGAFDAHYETFLESYYQQVAPGWQTKVVAATATIEGAERQVDALYQRPTITFPSDGPRLEQSFYAYAHPTRVQRRMVGVIPRSVSRTYAIEKAHEEYARVVQEYRANPGSLYNDLQAVDDAFSLDDAALPDDPTERADVLRGVLDDYEVQVSYHHSKDNTDLMMRVLRTMINQHLNTDGDPYEPLKGQLMTGETPISTVQEVIDELDPAEYTNPGPEDIRMLIATSMISHGVDQPVLNFISFFGLPRETAEYIQSYSRVGREWPGTVFLLHDPVRTRDRSYYTKFRHHQKYQDLLVEATPLERWAEFAIECTMPGIFCAILIQYYDSELEGEFPGASRVYMYEGFETAVREDRIDIDEMYELVRKAYGLEDGDAADNTRPDDGESTGIRIYERKIRDEFDKVWDALRDSDNQVPPAVAKDPDSDESNFVSGLLERDDDARKPMRSLRDIDEQVNIRLDNNTSRIINGYRQ